MLCAGIRHRVDPGCGVSLEMTSSVYPGFHTRSLAIGMIEGRGNLRARAVLAVQRFREGPRRGLKARERQGEADLGLLSPLLFATTKLISSFLTLRDSQAARHRKRAKQLLALVRRRGREPVPE